MKSFSNDSVLLYICNAFCNLLILKPVANSVATVSVTILVSTRHTKVIQRTKKTNIYHIYRTEGLHEIQNSSYQKAVGRR